MFGSVPAMLKNKKKKLPDNMYKSVYYYICKFYSLL